MTIKEARIARGLTQEQLARRARAAKTTIANHEQGRTKNMSILVYLRICAALGVNRYALDL